MLNFLQIILLCSFPLPIIIKTILTCSIIPKYKEGNYNMYQ